LILVNDSAVGFEYTLKDSDWVSVYPRFRILDITSLTNVRPPALDSIRFVLDTHLGRLAAYLRMLGFDSLYWNQAQDEQLAHISHDQNRILLTRDRGLLKRNSVIYGYCVRSTNPRHQLKEIAQHFELAQDIQPFRRCMRCNGILEAVDKEQILERLPAGVRESHDEFRRCPECCRIYWRGSHFKRMDRLVSSALDTGIDF
jgi:uncharacterized protein with PIN domain